jgi:F0F1-type ATP synthase assembly protein I
MNKTNTAQQPSPSKGITKTADIQSNPSAHFFLAVANMSWQLAIVVLVPILGGYGLDKALHISPILAIIGLVIALLGTVIVVRRQIRIFGTYEADDKEQSS